MGSDSTRCRSASSTPISADMRKPYYVCGGLQDNGSWCGPSSSRTANGVVNSDWYRVGGGDGFFTANDPTDWATVYWESQDGNTSRTDLRTGRSMSIRPRPTAQAGRGGGAAAAEGSENTCRPAARGAVRRRRTERRAACRRPAPPTASTGARRSSCRRTIREPSTSAAIGCSARTTAVKHGPHRRI